jgi:predicted aspartyl protease
MGEIRSTIELENERDRGAFESGHLEEHKIRSVEIEGVVDTGARTLALPQDVADQLGLPVQREITVGYADDRRETRPVSAPSTSLSRDVRRSWTPSRCRKEANL